MLEEGSEGSRVLCGGGGGGLGKALMIYPRQRVGITGCEVGDAGLTSSRRSRMYRNAWGHSALQLLVRRAGSLKSISAGHVRIEGAVVGGFAQHQLCRGRDNRRHEAMRGSRSRSSRTCVDGE
jgi:hypothetical protein